ncbi:Asp23/Gls24 family envelope stress response protein [Jongsikchunia kroppenstedtii]|uniref:Asp23/Gls24 family envelope stress response protein n=1 Tax=Jongsikchunia kroppenstedtii TaxID=1121721 RepID=UPI0003728071|nr:Asp23/Gls24 family envelope stress response protein [Jongsikchunia kroppenstedtii]
MAESSTGKTTSRSAKAEETKQDSSDGNGGRTTIADAVVEKIAGIAAREIGGVHDLGGGAERVVGKVREVLPGSSPSLSQGVAVEVGERQAAVDLDIVADYGVAIHDLAEAIRRNVGGAIEQMTGLEVTEVNITVHDVYLQDDDDPTTPDSSRVE